MERQNLSGPFDLHLRWFGDVDPPPEGGAGGEGGESRPAGSGEPGPELTAAPWLAQAPDRYKKSPEFLKDLLQGDRAVKSWGDVLDRMYAGEKLAGEHQATLTDLQAKLTAAEARALEKGSGPAPAEFKPEDYSKISVPKLPPYMLEPTFKGYAENLGVYFKAGAEEIKALAVGEKVPPATAQKLVNLFTTKYLDAFRASVEDEHQRREAGLKALKESWRGDFEKNQEIARRALASFGGPALTTEIAARGYGNDPAMLKIFHGIGLAISEGQLVPGKPGPTTPGAAPGMSDREAQQAASYAKRYPKMRQGE